MYGELLNSFELDYLLLNYMIPLDCIAILINTSQHLVLI